MCRLSGLACCLVIAGCAFQGKGLPAGTDAALVAPATCLEGMWCHRKAITIRKELVTGGPHASFPVLVHLTDPELATAARLDGFDVVFTAADGITRLAYEREQYVPATGELVVWLAVPDLSSTADTTIYLYFGNLIATDQQVAAAVWDATYQGVWHLSETAGTVIRDSTSTANHGAALGGAVIGELGTIGTAVTFDGIDDAIAMVDSPSLDSTAATATFGLWINWVDAADGVHQVIMSSSNRYTSPRDGFEWASQYNGNHYFYPWGGNDTNYNLGANPFTDKVWSYIVVTLAFATRDVTIYVNGAPMPFTATHVPTLWTAEASPDDWLWGGNPTYEEAYFTGGMDELRVANVVRTVGWIATEYRNQSAPASFIEVGQAVVLPTE